MFNIDLLRERIDAHTMSGVGESYTVDIPDEQRGPRKYLGLSALGDVCPRKVWYNFRHCKQSEFPPRMLRLFRRGAREEFVFNILLRVAGLTIHETDANGKQFKVVELEGHLSGHMDGVATAPPEYGVKHPFLLEYKSYNDKRFSELCKRKVAVADPKYYAQMQGYMGLEKLKAALFCAVNKNDDSLYFEWVVFNRPSFNRLMEFAEDIVNRIDPPEKISSMASDYRCRFCECSGICHKGESSEVSCRSCKFAEPVEDCQWVCKKGREYGVVCELWGDVAK